MGGGDSMHSSQRQPRQTCYPVLPTHSGILSDSVDLYYIGGHKLHSLWEKLYVIWKNRSASVS